MPPDYGLKWPRASPFEPPISRDGKFGVGRKSHMTGFPLTELRTSCQGVVQQDFERALALLHSFAYEDARRRFTAIAEKDPSCAMAWWGVAMTYYHPIWTAPDSDEFAAGLAAIRKARALKAESALENDLIRSLETFYTGQVGAATGETGQSCHGPIGADYRACAVAYRNALEQVYAKHSGNPEAASFFALQLVATATPGDPTLSNQKRAAEILEKFYATRKDHPGLAHYLIHSYDYPPLAQKGLPAANDYAGIAPWVPHALHMPSHIFTRLGMWQENIRSNLASADASRKLAARNHPDAAYFEELHALDYLAYGYLQTAQDSKAKQVLDRLYQIKKTHPPADFVAAYATAAIPARYALERRQWAEAAALTVPPAAFWSQFPFAEAHIAYARALGAARTGDPAAARQAAGRLEKLALAVKEPRFKYFADQAMIQRNAALGWIVWTEDHEEDAVRLLRQAAEQEDSLGKHPVSPGAILPVRDLLAEVLLETGEPAAALTQYEVSLKLYPARYNGIYGAARASQRAGRADQAKTYYQRLIELAKNGDGARPGLAEARAFVATH